MHPLVKASAAAVVLCGFGFNSQAATNCLSQLDVEALHVASVQQQLMVAGSACRENSARSAQFAQRYQSDLQASDATLLAFFSQHNPQSGSADFHMFKTRLADLASVRAAREPAGFCERATEMLIDALSGKATLSRFAATQPVDFEMPVVACEEKAPPPTVTAAAAPNKPVPQKVAQIPMRPAEPALVKGNAQDPEPHFAMAQKSEAVVTPHIQQTAQRMAAASLRLASKPAAAFTPPVIAARVRPVTRIVTPRIELAANVPVVPPIYPTVKPSVPEDAAPSGSARVAPRRTVNIATERVAQIEVRPPVFPTFKPDAPDVATAPTEELARADRNVAAPRKAPRPHLRVAVQPPIFPTAKPFIASAPPRMMARAEVREETRSAEPPRFRPRTSRSEQDSYSTDRHDRRTNLAERDRAARIARMDERVAREDSSSRSRGDRHYAALAPKPSLTRPVRVATRAAYAPHKVASTASHSTLGPLADIDQILARLTAPSHAAAAAATAALSPKVPNRPSTAPSGVQHDYGGDVGLADAGRSAGPQNGGASPAGLWANDRPQGRNAPAWNNDPRNSTLAQNDEGTESQQDKDQSPPARYRYRHGRPWDSIQGRDSYDGARWDSAANDDRAGAYGDRDDEGPNDDPPERDDERYFRPSWY